MLILAFLFGIMLLLIAINTPIGFAIGIASVLTIAQLKGLSVSVIASRMFTGIDSFVFTSVPLFILLGEILESGKITQRIVDFANTLVGHIKGGMGHVTVVSEMILSGITGAAASDAVTIGSIFIPAMTKAGYSPSFSAAIVGASSTLGPLIPPSIVMIVYGGLARVSVGRLFLGGAIPGILMGVGLMIVLYIIARRKGMSKEKAPSFTEFAAALRNSIWILPLPVLIMAGIVGGVFTATECAAAACLYALFLAMVIYKHLAPKDLRRICQNAALSTAKITFIVACSTILSWIVAREQILKDVLALPMFNENPNPYLILFIINIFLLIAGCFMEALTIVIIVTPILLPLITQVGIDPLHFGVILTLNVTIGMLTPPIGVVIYIVCGIAKISMEEFVRELWPFLLALVAMLFAITYLPSLSVFLPNLLMPV